MKSEKVMLQLFYNWHRKFLITFLCEFIISILAREREIKQRPSSTNVLALGMERESFFVFFGGVKKKFLSFYRRCLLSFISQEEIPVGDIRAHFQTFP